MSVYVIAEAGVNHNGSRKLAHQLIDAAFETGADAVKFQTFVPEKLVSARTPKAAYQSRNQPDNKSQLEMLRALALPAEAFPELMMHCQQRGIAFLSSPFDEPSAHLLLEQLRLPKIKLGSGELTNGPLLWQLGKAGSDLILSTGMATLAEIREALGLLCHARRTIGNSPETEDFSASYEPGLLQGKVTLLHCTTEYPCPLQAVNLRAMDTLKETFGLPVGYSDHTEGTTVALAAAARGASMIEKHLTLDRSLPGPDHAASTEPGQFKALVRGIRDVERALGGSEKKPTAAERDNASVVRKSLCALRAIEPGEPLSRDNLSSKRPGTGISPMKYWKILGATSPKKYAEDELLKPTEIDISP